MSKGLHHCRELGGGERASSARRKREWTGTQLCLRFTTPPHHAGCGRTEARGCEQLPCTGGGSLQLHRCTQGLRPARPGLHGRLAQPAAWQAPHAGPHRDPASAASRRCRRHVPCLGWCMHADLLGSPLQPSFPLRVQRPLLLHRHPLLPEGASGGVRRCCRHCCLCCRHCCLRSCCCCCCCCRAGCPPASLPSAHTAAVRAHPADGATQLTASSLQEGRLPRRPAPRWPR